MGPTPRLGVATPSRKDGLVHRAVEGECELYGRRHAPHCPRSRPQRIDSETNRGVSPFGHATELRVFIDPDLLQHPEVWAAAGTWHDVFGIEPHKLVEASGGLVTDLKR